MKTVCVTGASGYIGSWLVKFLLQRGYTVNASVLDLNDTKETAHLLTLEGARERLHLFKENLLEEGSFDAAIDGCEGVFHLACPASFDVEDPQGKMIHPTLKGALNVLKTCVRASSIKKVVLTSTLGCNPYIEKYPALDDIVDETWWSVPDIYRERKWWHVLSKILAEEAAWKFAKDKGINMVVMNPGLVVGPMLQPTLNASAASIFNLVNGAETFPNLQFWWVDVRDVVNAHILAFENSSSNGRYCLVKGVKHYSEIVQILRKLYPSMKLPERCVDDQPFVPLFQVSREKVNSLGLEFTPLEQTMKDTIESFKEKNFLKTSTTC